MFFVGLFFFTVVAVILHIYKDDIKQYAVTALNEYLTTDVNVRNIEVSIFHDFPNASIAFEHVFIADAFEEIQRKDTLLFAQQLYLTFNLMDIWKKDYTVKKASIHNGQINLKTTRTGDVNYNIIKASEETSATENFKFLLDLLSAVNMDFVYNNLATKQVYDITIQKAKFRGDFASNEYDLLANGDLIINKIKSASLNLITRKKAYLDLALNINTLQKIYKFEKGMLDIEKMSFNVNGFIKEDFIDLTIIGKQIGISDVINSLVAEDKKEAEKYKGEGIVSFNAEIKGVLERRDMPSVQANFVVNNASITEPVNKLKIYGINLIGHYQNKQIDRDEYIAFSEFSVKLLNSHLQGSAEIKNFSQPTLTTKAKGDIDLAAFQTFFQLKDIEKLAGNINLNVAFEMEFYDPEFRMDKFNIISSNGNLILSNVAYKPVGDVLEYKNISGEILIINKDAAAKDIRIQTANSDLLLDGALQNFIPFLEGTGTLGLIASLTSTKIDLNEFIGEGNKNSGGPPVVFKLPENLNLNLEMKVGKLIWDQHQFEDISGKFLLADRKAKINQLQMKTLGGHVNGALALNNLLLDGNIIEGTIGFSNVDVKSLFAEWDNFDQKAITSDHLSGKVSGNIDLLLFFNPYFSILDEKIYALSDIEIKNGALVNLETMKAITEYMRSNKALRLMLSKHIDRFEEKLMNLKFSEIKNQIEIKNRRLTIPKMKIVSNALDIELFGWHDFDNNIEYHFSFRFRDLKTKPTYTEFGKIEDDGLGIIVYLTMSGNIDNPTFALDKDERKNDIKESVEQEKSTVKSMLKTEFGMFKKDSTVQKVQPDKKREFEFIFYEEDSEDQKDEKVKEKNKGRVGKFFDKLKDDADKDSMKYEPVKK